MDRPINTATSTAMITHSVAALRSMTMPSLRLLTVPHSMSTLTAAPACVAAK